MHGHFLHSLHVAEDLSTLTDLADHVLFVPLLLVDTLSEVCYEHLRITLHLEFIL